MIAFILLACNEQNYSTIDQEDFFQQQRINTVDVLLVVDNSCSMAEEQNKLATNFDSFIQYFSDADVSWQIGVVTTDTVDPKFSGHLIGGDDELILSRADGTVVDEVDYDRNWPVAPGAVFSLDPSWATAVSNDSFDHWCVLTTSTPGAANPSCAATQGNGPDPRYGEVIVSEFVPDPDGVSDDQGEWLELTNLSDADVDLSGWTLSDHGRNRYTFPEGSTIAASGTLVLARSTDTSQNGGIDAQLALGADFTLNNHDLFLTRDTEGASEIFSEMVAQGTSGSGIEMGLEGPRMALMEPDQVAYNAGFVRDDANLSILVVSDEEDSSPLSVNEYLRDFADIKGPDAYRDHARMNVSSVVGDKPPKFEGEPSCSSANGEATYGSRYVYAAEQTNGLIDSICDEDFSPIVAQLGLTLSGLNVEFALSRVPAEGSLKVSIYDSPDESSKVKDLTVDVDYTYVPERNSILFQSDQVPKSEQYIKASYKIKSGT
jgi:hypothetical protein